MSSESTTDKLPFGEIQGYAPGDVPAFCSDYDSVDGQKLPRRSDFRHYVDGVYTGYKWQCVEFARRWLLVNKGYVFDDIAMAYDIFRLPHVTRIADQQKLPLKAFRNGSLRHPEPGCMLIWSEGGEFQRTGHVAIVTAVYPDRIRVAEQNVSFHAWPEGQDFARELQASSSEDGSFWIKCSFSDASVLGWVIQSDNDLHAEAFAAHDPRLYNLQLRELAHSDRHERSWLNPANPDEAAYIRAQGGHSLVSAPENQYKYFVLSESAHAELKRATNELHALFMHATEYVLQDDRRLAKFNIPEVLWPRIHQSWNNRRNQMITGRFDFCLTDQGLKLYEYNADSASCHMECGKIQGKWASHFGCDDGIDAGEHLHMRLRRAWQDSEVDGIVHIMLDEDMEELYHGLFMKEALESAGHECRLIRGMRGLHWDSQGNIVDEEGLIIKWVWKSWAWETALDQLRKEMDEDAQLAALNQPKDIAPRLMDVLFRPHTMVFEPMWTLIPSNKAILPILWQLFPDNPYLLDSRYEPGEDLRRNGYVSKPIAGRCGHNISLFDRGNTVLNETSGNFEHQNAIYQQLWCLPNIDGLQVQVCTFSVNGLYGGSCVRTDPSLIITTKSDLMPLRIVTDKNFLQGLDRHQ